MAWPLSRLRTYASGTVVPAADLNSIQDGIIDLCTGAKSVLALWADGTGGNAVSPQAGGVYGTRFLALPSTSSIVLGTGAGAGASSAGSILRDTGGSISIAAAGAPAATAAIATLTFGLAYPNGAYVDISPGNAAAAALSGTTQAWASSGPSNQWVLTSGAAALSAGTTYVWTYHVLGFKS